MIPTNLKDLYFLVQKYNEYNSANYDLPFILREQLLQEIKDYCSVLQERYKGTKFYVKNFDTSTTPWRWTKRCDAHVIREMRIEVDYYTSGRMSLVFYDDTGRGSFRMPGIHEFEQEGITNV